MWNGKKKAITFSYDDGVTQDIRLIELFNKYGIKATFNLNSELLGLGGALVRDGRNVTHIKNKPEDVKKIYEGHEVAVHTLTHPFLPDIEDEAEIIRQVEEDRKKLSALVGYEVVGMAYPCGGKNNDDRTARIIKEHTGVKYARALETNGSFDLQKNLFRFQGTCYHHAEWEKMHALADSFLSIKSEEPQLFYIWGHAYEFDIFPERWALFEDFLRKISGRADIFYGTNKDVLLG
jgi:peptidoglycan/xylan/chitin deacetylase (PgdA/CDA1 family)